MGKAWEEVAPQIWEFFQNGVQVKMIRVSRSGRSEDSQVECLESECQAKHAVSCAIISLEELKLQLNEVAILSSMCEIWNYLYVQKKHIKKMPKIAKT